MSPRQKQWSAWITLIGTLVAIGVAVRVPLMRLLGVQTVEASQLQVQELKNEGDARFRGVYNVLGQIMQSVEDIKGRQECAMLRVPYERCPAIIAEKNRGVKVP